MNGKAWFGKGGVGFGVEEERPLEMSIDLLFVIKSASTNYLLPLCKSDRASISVRRVDSSTTCTYLRVNPWIVAYIRTSRSPKSGRCRWFSRIGIARANVVINA